MVLYESYCRVTAQIEQVAMEMFKFSIFLNDIFNGLLKQGSLNQISKVIFRITQHPLSPRGYCSHNCTQNNPALFLKNKNK